MFYEVMLGKGAGKLNDVLTYHSDDSLFEGAIVEVPIGKNKAPGVIIKKVAQPDFKCKEIIRILYSKPLPKHLIQTAKWISGYYQAPASLCLGMMLPTGVLKKRRTRPNKTEHDAKKRGSSLENAQYAYSFAENDVKMDVNSVLPLNPAQKMAVEGLKTARSTTKLLFGVTGSGKTNIYVRMAINAFKEQKSVILLVPEIALTSQLVQNFYHVFGHNVVKIHSKQTEVERQQIFDSLLMSEDPRIIVGPRSALFAPVNNLGLIIVDEEHESTYYQDQTPKYSAVRVASYMASVCGCNCILGSATPTVVDYHIASLNDSMIKLTEKAKKTAIKPKVSVIDLKNRESFLHNRYFSDKLLVAIQDNLEHERQTLIFHNRRGSSSLTICEKCGNEMLCPNCFLPLTLHADDYKLICHTCGYNTPVPPSCPQCGHPGLIHKGFGTKLLETEIKRFFPEAKVKRFDADNKKGETLEDVYQAVKDGEVDILVGTQMLAKGLDLPKLATVGVVQADAGLALPDYAAEEKVFQLITQVIGRVGRGHSDIAEVFIQTFQPEHKAIQFAIDEDYEGFADYLLAKRKKAGFPPYKYVAKLDITLKTEAIVLKKVREAARRLSQDKRLLVSPPMPAFHERTSRGYTWEIVVRASSRKVLVEACIDLDKNFRVALDPPSLL